jgi:hypothetical protein
MAFTIARAQASSVEQVRLANRICPRVKNDPNPHNDHAPKLNGQ